MRLTETDAPIPVLMYHSISMDEEHGVAPYYRLSTSPGRFREHMRWLKTSGYATLSLEQALDASCSGVDTQRSVVLTFDDGYLDFLTGAWPILQEFSFSATVFLPTAFVADTRRRFKSRECLTWSEVRELASRGVCFGSHTVTHPKLHGLPWQDVQRELRESRDEIERVLGTPVTTFAYPFAFPQQDDAFVSNFCAELRSVGYRASVTTIVGRLSAGADSLRIKRLPVNDADDIQLFSAKLAGAYDWVGALQAAWKRAR